MRDPETIPDLGLLQIKAYYYSFLESVDTDKWDALDGKEQLHLIRLLTVRTDFTTDERTWVRKLMQRFPQTYPCFQKYSTQLQAWEFLVDEKNMDCS